MPLHSFVYQRSPIYRRVHAEYVLFGLMRLKGFSWIEATLSRLAHKICGTKMYYYPKHRREEMARCREAVKNG